MQPAVTRRGRIRRRREESNHCLDSCLRVATTNEISPTKRTELFEIHVIASACHWFRDVAAATRLTRRYALQI